MPVFNFSNIKLLNSIPLPSNSSLNLPYVGFGYNPSLYGQLNDQRVGNISGIGIISGGAFAGTRAVDSSLITLAISNPPSGFDVGWSTFDPTKVTAFLNNPNYEVKQFCGCANHNPNQSTGHSWVYVVYPKSGVTPPDDWDNTGSLNGEVPTWSGNIVPPDTPVTPPPPVIGVNVTFTYTPSPVVATFFDIALELRGNTYCAANNTRDSGKRWIPATPPQTETWDHAFFSIFQNRLGGWNPSTLGNKSIRDLLTSLYLPLQSNPNKPNPYIPVNGSGGEGLLIHRPLFNSPATPLPNNNTAPIANGSVYEVCREGCKTINVVPVPLPNELPDTQKYEIVDDVFEAYNYVFVRNFQSVPFDNPLGSTIRWDSAGVQNKITYSNEKLNEFLQRYVPLRFDASLGPVYFNNRQYNGYYRYDRDKINLGFFIDFSVCEGYIGEHWYGASDPFQLEAPGKRTIYFVNGVEIEIEGAIRYSSSSVKYELWRNYNRYWASLVGILGVAEETMIYVIKRRFPYKIKIPKHHLPDGYELKIFPKLANFFFDNNGNENNFAAYPTIFDVFGMAFDKDSRPVVGGGAVIPGPPYIQSNFTFPACYHIVQQPITLPPNTNGSIRVFNHPNPTTPTVDVDGYDAPINQTVSVILHPKNNGKNEFGVYPP